MSTKKHGYTKASAKAARLRELYGDTAGKPRRRKLVEKVAKGKIDYDFDLGVAERQLLRHADSGRYGDLLKKRK